MHIPNGIHHIAICTADMRTQLEFFSDVLGLKLVGLFWMHGVEGTWHAFMELEKNSFLSFVQTPDTPGIPHELGVTHAGQPGGSSSSGTLQHVALNVDDLEGLLGLRDRIRSRGVNVFGPLDHGICHSIYFAGPEDLTLEIATNGVPMTDQEWIDPEVVDPNDIDMLQDLIVAAVNEGIKRAEEKHAEEMGKIVPMNMLGGGLQGLF